MNLSVGLNGSVKEYARLVRAGEPELWTWSWRTGEPDRAAVLLLSPAEAPSSRWPYQLLATIGAVADVIGFDTRDAGSSGDATEPYLLDDLVADALAVLDFYDVESTHVIGASMGGMIAQKLALVRPSRVRTLTLVATSAGPRDDLPGPEPWLVERMAERLFADPPTDPIEQVDYLVTQQEWFSGRDGFDRLAAERTAASEVSAHWRTVTGHGHAVVEAGEWWGSLSEIDIPTRVVHGTHDPVYPVEHGIELANRIPNATLEMIDGLGHEITIPLAEKLGREIRRTVVLPENPKDPPSP